MASAQHCKAIVAGHICVDLFPELEGITADDIIQRLIDTVSVDAGSSGKKNVPDVFRSAEAG